MLLADGWISYELLDTAHGEKLERWGEVILRRPDPQVIWPHPEFPELWKKADAVYHRSEKGGGKWEFKRRLSDQWSVDYRGLRFGLKAMGFKHTGLFPEQSVNWDWMIEKIKNEKLKIRNVEESSAASRQSTIARSVIEDDGGVGIGKSQNAKIARLRDAPGIAVDDRAEIEWANRLRRRQCLRHFSFPSVSRCGRATQCRSDSPRRTPVRSRHGHSSTSNALALSCLERN